MTGSSLEEAIKLYSRNKDGSPKEVTDGLCVLGVPVGSTSFCQNFIAKAMSNAASDSVQLLQSIESEQTALQLFRQCTVHKLTHLYASDVMAANGDINDTAVFPVEWDC